MCPFLSILLAAERRNLPPLGPFPKAPTWTTRLIHPRPHLGSGWFVREKVPNWPSTARCLTQGQLEAITSHGGSLLLSKTSR